MTPRKRLSSATAAGITLILACTGDMNQPQTTGGLALEFAIQGAATAPLDAMTVNISGPTPTTINLVQSGGFWEGTAENLLVGTYSLTAIGQGAGEVTYYGTQSGVNVSSGVTTDASVPIVEFIPVISSVTPSGPTKIMTFEVTFSGVTHATTYKIEWESGATGGFVNTTGTTAQVAVTVIGDIEFKVRAGNADVDPDDAQESTPQIETTEADAAGKDSGSATNHGSGAGTNVTLTDFNIAPATEEDWFFVNVVGGERLIARVRTESLSQASALDPVLTVYEFGGAMVAQNDDIDNTTVESAIMYVPAQSGQHYIVVSSSGGTSTGHYEVTMQIDNNQPVTHVDVDPASATITTGSALQLTATPRDVVGGSELFRPVTWTTTDNSVATVDANGLVTGVADGAVTIVATSEGVTGKSDIMVVTPPMSDITSVGAGINSTCATTDDFQTFCWGDNGRGQLGNGSNTPSLVPVQVAGGHNFVTVFADGSGSSGGFACGITIATGGNVLCWGAGFNGELGDGTAMDNNLPVNPSGARTYLSLETGASHACAIQATGQVYCWGSDNFGQLGVGNIGNSLVPVPLTDGNLYSDIAAGNEHTCALLAVDGSAWCFGFGGTGELGDGLKSNHGTPTLVLAGLLFDQITAGDAHTCGIDQNGDIWCWGWNDQGQLGNGGSAPDQCLGTLACEGNPVQVSGTNKWIDVAAGNRFTCGINTSNQLFCWGDNMNGKLGQDPGAIFQIAAPSQVATPLLFDDVEVGREHACAIAQDGDLYCWGSNINGQLGDGTTNSSFQLVRVGLPLQ